MSGPAPVRLETTRGVVGKLPTQGDFVRVRAFSREVRALEHWMEEGLFHARRELGGGFERAYEHLYHRFIYRPDNCDKTVLGVLCAAVDSHGRRYPFVAFDVAPTGRWDADPLPFPVLLEDLFDELEAVIADVAVLEHVSQIHGRVQAPSEPLFFAQDPALVAAEALAAEERYRNFLSEVTCGEIGGDRGGPKVLDEVVRRLSDSKEDPRRFPFALDVPLSRPSLARGLEIRFWLDLCVALLRGRAPTLSLFWKTAVPPPRRSSLQISFRQPASDLFVSLLRPEGPARGLFRPGEGPPLTGAPSAFAAAEFLGSALERVRQERSSR